MYFDDRMLEHANSFEEFSEEALAILRELGTKLDAIVGALIKAGVLREEDLK